MHQQTYPLAACLVRQQHLLPSPESVWRIHRRNRLPCWQRVAYLYRVPSCTSAFPAHAHRAQLVSTHQVNSEPLIVIGIRRSRPQCVVFPIND